MSEYRYEGRLATIRSSPRALRGWWHEMSKTDHELIGALTCLVGGPTAAVFGGMESLTAQDDYIPYRLVLTIVAIIVVCWFGRRIAISEGVEPGDS